MLFGRLHYQKVFGLKFYTYEIRSRESTFVSRERVNASPLPRPAVQVCERGREGRLTVVPLSTVLGGQRRGGLRPCDARVRARCRAHSPPLFPR